MDESSGDETSGMKRPAENTNKKHRITKISMPKPFNGNVVEYTENTTIHGVKYLGELQRPWAEKLFWIIIFLFCFIFLGYFMRDVISKWKKCPVILVEDDLPTPIYTIPFPAVTICPQIKSKYDKFSYESIGKLIVDKEKGDDLDDHIPSTLIDYEKKIEIAQQICHSFITKKLASNKELSLSETIDDSHIKLLYELAPNLNETIEEADYKIDFIQNDGESSEDSTNNNENVKHLFSTVLTNEGVCFTFNMPKDILREETVQKTYPYNDINLTSSNWDSEHGYKLHDSIELDFFPIFMYGAGKEFGLQMQLKSLVNDMNRLCQPTQIGFKIALHSPSVYPTTYEDYILISYESINNIAVKPKIIKTSESLRMYSPHRRQCYFGDEKRLKYYAFYNKVNCKLECLSNYTMQNYKCVHYSLPMDPGTSICGAKGHGAYSQMYNNAENMESLINLIKEIDPNLKYDKLKDLYLDCDCLPECNSIQYSYDVEIEPINYHKMNEKVQEALNSTMELDEVYTEINIFIKDTEILGKTRNQLYTFSDLVSNFGGLLGLFMGASILSIVEFIYFCVIRQICKSKTYCVNETH